MGVLEAMKFIVSTYMFQIWKKNSVVNKLYFLTFLSNKIRSQWHLLPGYKQEYQIYRSIYQSATTEQFFWKASLTQVDIVNKAVQ